MSSFNAAQFLTSSTYAVPALNLIERCEATFRGFLEPVEHDLFHGAAFTDVFGPHLVTADTVQFFYRRSDRVLVEVGEALELSLGDAEEVAELIDRELLVSLEFQVHALLDDLVEPERVF